MRSKLVITILGCGSSGGVPRTGMQWGACNPDNPLNYRQRCSLLIEKINAQAEVTRVLIDMSPDMRAQLIGQNIQNLDAVLLTHAHADHVHGIDDLRPIVQARKQLMPVYMNAITSNEINKKFGYIFKTPEHSFYPPIAIEHSIEDYTPFVISGAGGSIEFLPLPLHHGDLTNPFDFALGFKFENCFYSPDVNAIPSAASAHLSHLKLWIIDALRYKQHESHFSVSDALEWIKKTQPEHAILTNLNIELDYDELKQNLPDHCEPAFDGLKFECEL